MRARLLPFLSCLPSVLGCGDGIGRPIVEREPSASAAGAPGGFGGAGSGGLSGLPSFGGRDWRGPEGEGRGDLPPGGFCDGIEEWSEESAWREFAAYEFLNYARASGFACGSARAPTVPPVTMKREIQCAARLHSRDMFEGNYLDHINMEGEGPEDRIRRAGYRDFRVASETIAQSDRRGDDMGPYLEIEKLLATGGAECTNLVDPDFDSVGIGFFGDRWTLDFAGP